jgi:hypothetical protein
MNLTFLTYIPEKFAVICKNVLKGIFLKTQDLAKLLYDFVLGMLLKDNYFLPSLGHLGEIYLGIQG